MLESPVWSTKTKSTGWVSTIPGIGRVRLNQLINHFGSLEALVLAKMGAKSSHIDQIYRSSGLPIATVSSLLTMMELKGLVRQTGAMNYVLAKEAREHYRVDID